MATEENQFVSDAVSEQYRTKAGLGDKPTDPEKGPVDPPERVRPTEPEGGYGNPKAEKKAPAKKAASKNKED